MEEHILSFAIHFEGFGFVFHHIPVQCHKIFYAAKRAARVSALAVEYHADDIAASLYRLVF